MRIILASAHLVPAAKGGEIPVSEKERICYIREKLLDIRNSACSFESGLLHAVTGDFDASEMNALPQSPLWPNREFPLPYPLQSSSFVIPPEGRWVPWGIDEIKAPSVWKKTAGRSVKIAVIDTGIDFNHPDLKNAAVGGINLVNRHLPPIDDNGHGTHIAGTIAAANRRSGITGVAPQALIYAVKAFDYNGTAYVSDIIQGIEWCVRNQIDIINMSFGMKSGSPALESAIRSAYTAGTVIVASSGNEGKTAEIDYPARYRHVIAVGATTKQRKVAPFSNRGKRIDIYAPGDRIVSTWPNNRYHELSGTSMSTSHVSGVIALLLALRPNLKPRSIKQLLMKNATAVTIKKRPATAGEVNAQLCLNALLSK
ncbi:S8 family peptidase [Gorillibacterium massiliense]|uniref:S8 family peptidase n=1 Tax=Gorillibacterium massiliense TaxID=1280390 RepID=UPI001EE3127A|nr:S8 family peptidase [Gorillibacterium massiliense]